MNVSSHSRMFTYFMFSHDSNFIAIHVYDMASVMLLNFTFRYRKKKHYVVTMYKSTLIRVLK